MKRFSLIATLLFVFVAVGAASAAKDVFVILEENVDAVLKDITQGAGTASKTTDHYFGSSALKVEATGADGQKFNPAMPGWAFKIVEKPAADDEFRYITFAWKKDGGKGIQLQLHGNPDTWGHRYHAGDNVKNWTPSIQVSKTVPTSWTAHTQDLFVDWKAFTLTGVAFTAWDGTAGLWDNVFLHKAKDATPVEPKGKLATTWASLKETR
jgi:hypothetical protein